MSNELPEQTVSPKEVPEITQLLTAYNNTYALGLNPEGYADCVHALDEIRCYLSCGYQIEDFCWENINNALKKAEL